MKSGERMGFRLWPEYFTAGPAPGRTEGSSRRVALCEYLAKCSRAAQIPGPRLWRSPAAAARLCNALGTLPTSLSATRCGWSFGHSPQPRSFIGWERGVGEGLAICCWLFAEEFFP